MRIRINILDAEILVAAMIKAADRNDDVFFKNLGKMICSNVKERFDDRMGKDRVNIIVELDAEDK